MRGRQRLEGRHGQARRQRLGRGERAADGRAVPEVRGAGVMRGVELGVDAGPVVDRARARGLLVNRTAERVVRLLPPLTVTAAEIDEAVAILDEVLTACAAEEQP
ncbi:MAG: aminotransferase class III-fold pyridoxal phosphate-dependent enzyme [Vicinamibacteria bacterium]